MVTSLERLQVLRTPLRRNRPDGSRRSPQRRGLYAIRRRVLPSRRRCRRFKRAPKITPDERFVPSRVIRADPTRLVSLPSGHTIRRDPEHRQRITSPRNPFPEPPDLQRLHAG